MSVNEIKLTESYIKLERSQTDNSLKTIVDCIKFHAATRGEKEAVVFASSDFTREAVTWSDLYKKARQTANAFIRLGVRKGEIIAVNVRNCPEWLYVVVGAMMAGALAVSIAFTYTDGSDLIAVMEKLQTCCLLVMEPGNDGNNWNIAKQFLELPQEKGHVQSNKMPYLRYLITLRDNNFPDMTNNLHFDDVIAHNDDDTKLPEVTENDIAFLFQTSGSTGVPKLIAHTHRAIRVCQQVAAEAVAQQESITFNDRPFAWIGGFPLTLVSGIKRVTMSGFCPPPTDRAKFLIEVAKKENCGSISVLPQVIHEFIQRQNELNFDWPVMVLATGGQPFSKGIAKCIGPVAPAIGIAYGATEFQIVAFAIVTKEDQFEENCCGKLFRGPEIELKIVDENCEVAPVGTYGEIYIRGDAVFKEYFHDKDKTNAVKTADGWFKTNDTGKLNENGVLYVQGRKSSTIVSGGMNVIPDVLERIIETYPGVEAAIIVPVPDEVNYQVLCACVRVRAGSDVSENQLRSFLQEHHNDKRGQFTVLPKFYMFLKEFPEVYTGKCSRTALVDLAFKRFGSQNA